MINSFFRTQIRKIKSLIELVTTGRQDAETLKTWFKGSHSRKVWEILHHRKIHRITKVLKTRTSASNFIANHPVASETFYSEPVVGLLVALEEKWSIQWDSSSWTMNVCIKFHTNLLNSRYFSLDFKSWSVSPCSHFGSEAKNISDQGYLTHVIIIQASAWQH